MIGSDSFTEGVEMLTNLQKSAAQAIVNIFETSRIRGDYGKVTFHPSDPGHLTYGRSQTTLASGNLFLLIKAYVAAEGAVLAEPLRAFLDRLEARDFSLDHEFELRRLLNDAGDDPIMQSEQEAFFDRVYWGPAVKSAESLGIKTALGTAVVYDSKLHGSWPAMRDRTIERFGPAADLGENPWITRYVEVRREWLANHSNTLLRKTVYRMESFDKLINEDRWVLNLPFSVRGIEVTEAALEAVPAVRVSAADTEERTLRLQVPRMVGDDVEQVQRALIEAGFPLEPDGVFGPATDAAVRRFQQKRGLVDDGIVGQATRAELGL